MLYDLGKWLKSFSLSMKWGNLLSVRLLTSAEDYRGYALQTNPALLAQVHGMWSLLCCYHLHHRGRG